MPDAKYPPGTKGQPVQAHSSKPDRTEPWRYVCPCGGQPAFHSANRLICSTCGETLEENELIDKKNQ